MNRASTYCFTEKVKYLLGMEFNTNSTKIIKKLLISCKKVKNEKLQTDSGKEVKNEKLQTGKSLIIIYNNCNENRSYSLDVGYHFVPTKMPSQTSSN